MEHFNRLTPAEAERLALLAEEMGEAIQTIGKVLRHGYDSRHPDGGETNKESLERECGDVRHCMIRLCDAGDLDKQRIHDCADIKAKNVSKYLHHEAMTVRQGCAQYDPITGEWGWKKEKPE